MRGAQTKSNEIEQMADEGAQLLRRSGELIEAGNVREGRQLLVDGMATNPALEAYIEQREHLVPKAFRRRLKTEVRRAKRGDTDR